MVVLKMVSGFLPHSCSPCFQESTEEASLYPSHRAVKTLSAHSDRGYVHGQNNSQGIMPKIRLIVCQIARDLFFQASNSNSMP